MYKLLRPLLFKLDPERSHRLATRLAQLAETISPRLLTSAFSYENPALQQELWGTIFNNPVGLAAGFDKNARLLPFWQHIGFGFAEVGSVSARPSDGNPQPRLFRLPDDRALVNRMGLNNDGADRIALRLEGQSASLGFPVGINLAKTHDPEILGEEAVEDFRQSFERLGSLADYIALNISCPNTREGKTFEAPEALDALLSAIFEQRRRMALEVPVLIKLSPLDSTRVTFDSALESVIQIAQTHGVDGFIASNTAADRQQCTTSPERLQQIGAGGLSGKPLEDRATHLVRYLYRVSGGRVPIIGVGGVFSAEDAYAKICAGASLVQLYTGLVYEGPGLIKRIKQGLVRLLERDGFASIGEAVGSTVDVSPVVDNP